MVRRTTLGNCAFGRGNGFIVARLRLPAGVEAAEMLWADDTFRPGAALGRGGTGRFSLAAKPQALSSTVAYAAGVPHCLLACA